MESRHYINGAWCASDSGAWCDSLDPASGERVGRFADGGRAEADAATEAASRAFVNPHWTQNPRYRQQVMLHWADRLETRIEALAELLTRENGKPLAQARGELAGTISEIRYYAGLARHVPGHALEVAPGEFSTLLREPAGVAALIIPWNAPATLLARAMGPALAVGCTLIIKPAPQTALLTAAMIECLVEIEGIPPGVINLLAESGSEIGEALVTDERVAVISFTGSTAVGQRIMAAAAPTMKKLSLELGGKAACLVFDDADISSIAPKLAAAATVIAGQQCTAARRILVHESRIEEMKRQLSRALDELKIGHGLETASQMGPLIDMASRDRVAARVEEVFDHCDEVILRGRQPGELPRAGAFLSPSLVMHADTSAFFCQEEIFGPLVVLEPFADEAEAVAKANHTDFGLAASVWTRDGARAMRVARALPRGTVWINDHNKLFAEAETGGYRKSGLGRLHGYDALADFTELKHVYQNVGVMP